MTVLCVVAAVFAQHAPSSPAPDRDGAASRVRVLLERGDERAAKTLTRQLARELDDELTALLDEIDRDFDDMSRQKARSDELEARFERLSAVFSRYEPIFEVHHEVNGRPRVLRRFQAKKLRIGGAEHTNRGDRLWDRFEYARALEEYGSAIAKLQEAIPLAHIAEDQKLVASCLNNIGYAEVYRGNATAGLQHYSEAFAIADRLGDDVYRGLYKLNLATYHLYMGDPASSLRYSQEASELTRKTGRRTWLANTLLNLGSAHLLLAQADQAEAVLQQALIESQQANDRRSRGRILMNLAFAAAQAKRDADAASRMEDARRWYEANADVYAEAERTLASYQSLSFLTAVYNRLEQPDRVAALARELEALRTRDPEKLAAYRPTRT
jgi:tetratricopeptide (TPR) repeat protein